MKALVTTATALFAAIVLTAVWLFLRPDPLGGEPFVELNLPTERPRLVPMVSNGQSRAALPSMQGVQMSKTDAQTPARDARATRKAAVKPAASGTSKTNEVKITYPGVKVVGLGKRPEINASPPAKGRVLLSPFAQDVALGPVSMAPVPIKALVEYTRYGPLPKVADDGRAPSVVYARPHKLLPRAEQGRQARIAILISGLGLSAVATHTAIQKLPGAVTLAFGPYGSNLQGWVRQARQVGHEVVLQIPLEPFDYPDNDPGPHTLLTSLPPNENVKRLKWLLARFTGYMGITNAMGAKFTAAKDALRPILKELKSRGLVYIDDGASPRSNAKDLSEELKLGFISSHVVIDSEQTRADIRKSLSRLETIAEERGIAIGVGGSLPVTLEEIAEWAEKLKDRGIDLIPISAAIRAGQPVNRS